MGKDKSTQEMKVVRDWLRGQITQIQRDPHLPIASKCISARIVKWDKRAHWVVVQMRDERVEPTLYNSRGTRWIAANTWGKHWKYDLWKQLNALVICAEHPETEYFPF